MHHPSLAGLVIGLLLLGVIFGVVERLSPAIPGVSIFRRDRATDYVYWFFTPLVTRGVSAAALGAVVGLFALALGFPGHVDRFLAFTHQRSPFARQPPLLQFVEALLVADFFAYWSHRAFHSRLLWRFHAIHHSATMLDWLSSTRLHPVNDVVSKLANAVPLLLLGFDTRVFAAVAPVLVFYSLLEHANVNWGLGPLRRVISTPLFHRWHHTSQDEGLDRNFAGLFPFYDMLFGTFYLPRDRTPQVFGVANEKVPGGFFAQLAYPFRSRPARRSAVSPDGAGLGPR